MYKVPIIPPDLRHQETIIQAASALTILQKTINCVFERIDGRITKNNTKVLQLGERINKAQAKIKGLEGTKNAIKMYAPARFPATSVFCDIPLTFPSTMETTNTEEMNDSLSQDYEIQSRVDAATPQAIKEKLVFFHVRTDKTNAEEGKLAAAKMQTNQQLGMGSVPDQLRSVNSVLRFNTDDCIYGVESADNDLSSWKRAKLYKNQRTQLRHPQSITQKQLLDPAPHSIANRNQMLVPGSEWRYTPRLHEAPEIDLPMDLPDLPNIADDIQFEGKEQQQIAPSLFIENLPELPELEHTTVEQKEVKATATNTNIPITPTATPPTSTTTTAPISVSTPPPPPPPPSTITAPPPPPPPPPAPSAATVGGKKQVKTTVVELDSRSELMDAIRKAGGSSGGRLRSAAAPIDVVDDTQPTATGRASTGSGRGDLMADLHNKLLMRRKGISGAKDNNNSINNAAVSNPLISRLSALISPPTVKAAKQEFSDEEADDDNEWND